MANFNRVILVGNLTRDPEVRYTPSGTAVSDIGLAVNRVWFDKQTNARREETSFFYVTLWGRQAEIAGEYLAKGRQVLIEGRLQMDQWDDRETGEKRSKLKIVGENMQMLGGRSDAAPRGAAGPSSHGGGGGGPSNYGGGGPSNYGGDAGPGYPDAGRDTHPSAPSAPPSPPPPPAPPEDEVPF